MAKNPNRIRKPTKGPKKDGPLDGMSFAEAASLGVPLASFFDNKIAAKRLLDEGLDIKIEDFDPELSAVRAARRPNLTTSSRLPGGSSLAEREGGLRFAEAQTDAREQQFDEFNDQFIQQQEAQNLAAQNQAGAMNTQLQTRIAAQNMATRKQLAGSAQNQANVSAEAAFKNLINMSNQQVANKAAKKALEKKQRVLSGKSGQPGVNGSNYVGNNNSLVPWLSSNIDDPLSANFGTNTNKRPAFNIGLYNKTHILN